MKYTLFVFDWDGTLVDSMPQLIRCKKQIAKEYKLPIPSDDLIKSVIGIEFKAAMQKCFPGLSDNKFANICLRFHELMKMDTYQSALYPHAIDVLKVLKSKHKKIAIATAKHSSEMDVALHHVGLTDYFDMVCSADKYAPKPLAAMLEVLVNQLNSGEKDTAVMIGDSITDIKFARNAKVDIVSMLFEPRKHGNVIAHKPEYVFYSWMNFYESIVR